MSQLPLPNLDDRTFAQLVTEGRSMIPGLDPQWTDENVSDPGITLIELLAWLTEMLLFRIDQVPPPYVLAFLKLLNGPNWQPGEDLDHDIAATLETLRRRERTVTVGDYRLLAHRASDAVERVHVLPRRNLQAPTAAGQTGTAQSHVSLVVVPNPADSWAVAPDSPNQKTNPLPSTKLLDLLLNDLEPRQPTTTHLHVVAPEYVPVAFDIRLAKTFHAKTDKVKEGVTGALAKFLSPLKGGTDADGWPFGTDVYLSDLFLLLSRVPGVDTVLAIEVVKSRPLLRDGTDLVALVLDDHQLPWFKSADVQIQGVAP